VFTTYHNTSNYRVIKKIWSRHGRDRMVVGFKTTYAITAIYHH